MTASFEEVVPFLDGAPLVAGEMEAYMLPGVSAESASLLDHCIRAVEKSLTAGTHGLPLIGNGDWNDGMNRVGHLGRGESVWLGWFLLTVLQKIAPLCERAGDGVRAARFESEAARLATMLELAWDGDWYRRAYYDDGSPLGSAQNDECKIDSISQTWAVLSGAAPLPRAERAMDAVRTHLMRRATRAVLLLDAAVRPVGAGPGLHQGLSAGHAGERRSVHPRRDLDDHGGGPSRQRRRGHGAVPHAEPGQPHADRGRCRSLQG